MDLLPPEYIERRYFAAEQAKLDELLVEQLAATQDAADYVQEHAIEGGLLWDASDDDGKVTDKLVKARLKEAKAEGNPDPEEVGALNHAVKMFKAEASAKKALKDATTKLGERSLAQYGKLSADDLHALVVDDKWGGTVSTRISAEVAALANALIYRLRVLADRYEHTLGEIDGEIDILSSKVASHLRAMGVQK